MSVCCLNTMTFCLVLDTYYSFESTGSRLATILANPDAYSRHIWRRYCQMSSPLKMASCFEG
jgi:hypothetical protein